MNVKKTDLAATFSKLTSEQFAEIQRRLAAKVEEDSLQEPIAIIGMQCRFPGAADLAAFWANLAAGVDSVGEIPADRFDFTSYFEEKVSSAGKMNTRWGGFLENVDAFDHRFFGISEPEARNLDPQHRLLLEVAWEALEDAGLMAPSFTESNTGVFIGISNRDYEEMLEPLENPGCIDPYFGTGNALSVGAGRISHILGLQGPSIAVDTACSSSLSAVHLACQSLRSGECDAALAGGVNLLLTPTGFIYGSQLNAMSPTGRVRSFSADADGYVRGEGCGIVVLKRLTDAQRDRDRILAVIRSSAMNHDGRASSLTAPNVHAQVRLLRSAWRFAGVAASDIGYIEVHGSGTPLGDPIEANAIANALDGRDDPLPVGSVKSNIGHLESAAGIAGLIKTVLCLKHRQFVPSLHVREINPHIRELPVEVCRSPRPWLGERRVAGVSSFGISGTNVHVVVEEWNGNENDRLNDGRAALLVLSAGTESGRTYLVENWKRHFAENEDGNWCDEVWTAATRRRHHKYRLAIVAESREEATRRLASWKNGDSEVIAGESFGEKPVVFVYSGQGGQWKEMGKRLLVEEKSFAEKIDAIDREVRRQFGWSIREHLALGREVEGEQMEITQVALFAIQSGLTALWRNWGVEPVAVIGHSMGEIAAAEAAKILTLAEAVEIVGQRSRLLEGVSEGAMFACELSAEEAEHWVEGSQIEIAAHNSQRWMVLSGPRVDAEQVAAQIEQSGRTVRWFKTSGMAGHSSQVDGACRGLRELLKDRKGRNGTIRMVSTVTGDWVRGEELDADYWAKNMRRRVRFVDGINRLMDAGYQRYLEIGPHPMLSMAISEAAGERQRDIKVMASMRKDQGSRKDLLETAGSLWAWGQRLCWENVLGPARTPVSLPSYPWQRSRFWCDFPRTSPNQPMWGPERKLRLDRNVSNLIDDLIDRWPIEGVHAINRTELAPYLFLPSSRKGLLFCAQTNRSITAFLYAGPSDAFVDTVREAQRFAYRQEWSLNVMALEGEASMLAAAGYSTTPFGLLQSIDRLGEFELSGASKRRLRYARERYAQSGIAETVECDFSCAEELIGLIDAWCRHKQQTPSFVRSLKRRLREQTIDRASRIFITRRNGRAECGIFLTPASLKNGYLMDLEFYDSDLPLGGLEYTIISIIEKLQMEKFDYLGLGGSYGTGLESHPHADSEAAALLQSLHDANVLNGDSNVQFKSKFRPSSQRIFLCRPPGASVTSVEDAVIALSGLEVEEEKKPPAMTLLNLCGETQIFETKLDASARHYFAGHRLEGDLVMPGAGLIDCMLQVARSIRPQGIALCDINIERPLPLDQQSQTIQVAVSESGEVRLYSDSKGWVLHCSARLVDEQSKSGESFDSREILPKLDVREPEDFYVMANQSGVEYMDEFRILRKLWIGKGEGVGWIGGAVSLSSTNGSCVCPPAMLDSAFQVLAATVSAFDGEMVLMRGVRSIHVFRPWPAAVWCHAKIDSISEGTTLRGSVRVCDITGAAVAEIEGVRAERLCGDRKDIANLHTVTWVESSLTDRTTIRDWIVLGASHREIDSLLALNSKVHCVDLENLDRVLNNFNGPITVVCFVPYLNDDPPLRARLCCKMALSVAQKLLRYDRTGIHLRFVTRNAQVVAGSDSDCDPGQAAVWGFCRSFAAEHPDLMAGIADIGNSSDDLFTLARWLHTANGFSQVAIRNGKLYVLQIEAQRGTSCDFSLSISRDATYLITGGFRGLGLATARYLVERGARHIVLTGRREATSEIAEAFRPWNISPYLKAIDVADLKAMRSLMAWIVAELPPLRGIVHSAVSIADAAVATASWPEFEEAFRPKIDGAWNLHQLTQNCELDFFFLYSSAASILGPAGQSAYAASNAFLDAFAAHRMAHGKPGCSIGWGPWVNIGRATDSELLKRFQGDGISPFETANDLNILPQLNSPYTLALNIDWQKFTRKHPFLRNRTQRDPATDSEMTQAKNINSKGITDLSTYMRTKVAELLGVGLMSVSENQSLRSLGIDSLSSIVLRNRIEADAGVRIPIVTILAAERLSDVTTALGDVLEQTGGMRMQSAITK